MGLIQEDTSPPDSTTRYSTAICHDIDIEGVVEERVVEGKMMTNISNVIHVIYLLNAIILDTFIIIVIIIVIIILIAFISILI